MNRSLLFTGALVIAFGGLAATAADKPDLTNHHDRINYALGQDIVSTFNQQDVAIDPKAFAAGMADALAGRPLLTPEQQAAALKELADQFEVKAAARRKIEGEKNLREGEEFLAANAIREGLKVIEGTAMDGSKAELRYEVMKSGAGPSPRDGDTVEVHYTGSRIDGTVFDSSVKRGTPATFGLHDVIPGWTAALRVMKAGDKWRLYIPAKLGFGEYGLPQLGPNCALIYDLELLSFFTPKPADPTPAADLK